MDSYKWQGYNSCSLSLFQTSFFVKDIPSHKSVVSHKNDFVRFFCLIIIFEVFFQLLLLWKNNYSNISQINHFSYFYRFLYSIRFFSNFSKKISHHVIIFKNWTQIIVLRSHRNFFVYFQNFMSKVAETNEVGSYFYF